MSEALAVDALLRAGKRVAVFDRRGILNVLDREGLEQRARECHMGSIVETA